MIPFIERKGDFGRFFGIIGAVVNDFGALAECNNKAGGLHPQFWRRTVCRSTFSYIEALTNALKDIALQSGDENGIPFSSAEQLALRDVVIAIEDGEVFERRAKTRFLDNVALGLKFGARMMGVNYTFQKQDGWQALVRASKVRDRLMHPRSPIDFEISDDEIKDIVEGFNWHRNEFTTIIAPLRAVLENAAETHGITRESVSLPFTISLRLPSET